MKKAIILANGQTPSKNIFRELFKKGYGILICADGGANSAVKLNLTPEYIIGDFDSIHPSTIKSFNGKSRFIKISRQNDTDVEKCIKFAIKKKIGEVILLGSTGDRLDHSFCNLGITLKYYNEIDIKIIHGKSILSVHTGKVKLKSLTEETISLYGFDSKTKITSNGLKYQLKSISLPFGQKESTSNVAVKNEIDLDIRNGKIFIIRNFKFMVKNGLF